jgi:hypothetical protein
LERRKAILRCFKADRNAWPRGRRITFQPVIRLALQRRIDVAQ